MSGRGDRGSDDLVVSPPQSGWPEWQHLFEDRKPYQGPWARRGWIAVRAGLHYIRGNSAPYFSVTGEISTCGGEWDSGGCLHDEVLKYWPTLSPVVALHLSDHDGVPSGAEPNAWYWLAGYYGGAGQRYHGGNSQPPRDPEDCLRIFAEHVRVPIDEALRLAHGWQRGVEYTEVRPLLADWIEQQKARWRKEAEEVIAVLDRLIAEQSKGK